MCSFIILLLLLCGNNGNSCNDCHDHNSGWNAGDYARSSDYRGSDEGCGCNREDYWQERDDSRRRNSERECGCSACESGQSADESSVVEREDIWTSYKKTSSGKG